MKIARLFKNQWVRTIVFILLNTAAFLVGWHFNDLVGLFAF